MLAEARGAASPPEGRGWEGRLEVEGASVVARSPEVEDRGVAPFESVLQFGTSSEKASKPAGYFFGLATLSGALPETL